MNEIILVIQNSFFRCITLLQTFVAQRYSDEDIAVCRVTRSNIYGRDITRVDGLVGPTTRFGLHPRRITRRLEITFSRLSSLPPVQTLRGLSPTRRTLYARCPPTPAW